MARTDKKVVRRLQIKRRIRYKIKGTTETPRLSVFRSNKQIYAQIINDELGETLVSCSSRKKELTSQPISKMEMSQLVGKTLAEMAKEKGVDKVVFDRGGYKYHGRIKALAEGAREGGLIF